VRSFQRTSSYALCWRPLAIAGIPADTPRVVALFVFPAFGARGVATTTALHRAVTPTGAPGTAGKQAEAFEILRLLLAAGADPSIKNKQGKRPADYATDEVIMGLLQSEHEDGARFRIERDTRTPP